jgi:hypothetical protein
MTRAREEKQLPRGREDPSGDHDPGHGPDVRGPASDLPGRGGGTRAGAREVGEGAAGRRGARPAAGTAVAGRDPRRAPERGPVMDILALLWALILWGLVGLLALLSLLMLLACSPLSSQSCT